MPTPSPNQQSPFYLKINKSLDERRRNFEVFGYVCVVVISSNIEHQNFQKLFSAFK
jgi:hypothetical protein